MVVFTSLEFIFRFLPVFVLLYWLTPETYRMHVLFVGSLIFYASGAGFYVLLLVALTFFNYVMGRWIYVKPGRNIRKSRQDQRKGYLQAVLITDLAVLVFFKVMSLFSESFSIPLGLSFYLFKMVSYQIDLYRTDIAVMPGFADTAAYFCMFPQLTQGPIMRYGQGGLDGSYDRRFSLKKLEDGLEFFVMGLGMKVLLADRLAILWNDISKIGFDSISTPLAWLGAYGYSLRLYFDFWGYSMMAAGAAMMLGFPRIVNFEHPYAAGSISDFYRKWHMTLGSWFRDYVYIPLGGSRQGALMTARNLLIVWALTGFWHGGTFGFLLWGLVLGLLIIWEKLAVRGILERLPLLGHLHVLVLIPLTWVIFAIPDLSGIAMYFARLFPFFGMGEAAFSGDFIKYLARYLPFLLVSVLLCVPGVYRLVIRHRRRWISLLILTVIFWVSVYMSANAYLNPFMYFGF